MQLQRWQRLAQVAIVTTALQDARGLRREILPWLAYHLELGIAHFYVCPCPDLPRLSTVPAFNIPLTQRAAQVLYDGTDREVVAALRKLTCVTLFFVRQPFASLAEIQEFETWDAVHWQWGGWDSMSLIQQPTPC